MRVAVIDGYSSGRFIPAMLRAHGVECVHVQSRKSTNPYCADTFEPENYVADLGCVDEAVAAERLRELGVDRVVAGTESGVALAARLGAATSGPYNDPDVAEASMDKALMYELARSAGLAVPVGGTFSSAAGALAWASEAGAAELVAKPTNSAGSDHVRFCADTTSLEAACREILEAANMWGDPNETVTVQERLVGQEASLNTVSQDGVHAVAEAWTGYKQIGAHNAPIYDLELPVPPGSDHWWAMSDYVFRLLDVLGVSDSPAHTEVVITESRGVVLLETGARLSGATIPAVIRQYLGMSQADLFVESIADPAFFTSYRPETWFSGPAVRYVNLINRRGGAAAAGYAEAFRKLPTFVAMSTPLAPGTQVERTSSLIDAPGYVYLSSPDAAAVDADYETIRKLEWEGLYTTSRPDRSPPQRPRAR